MIINPDTLKKLRKRNGLSQAELAIATEGNNKVSTSTIKRIETAKADHQANPRVAKALAMALKVNPEDLAKAPMNLEQNEVKLQKLGYRALKTVIDRDTALSFQMVEHLYGIPIRSQVLMAPLFAALLAEESLAWRRDKLAVIDEAVIALKEQGRTGGMGGYLSFAHLVGQVEKGAEAECSSIESRDLFGRKVVATAHNDANEQFDPSTNNPFANYLCECSSKFNSGDIETDLEILDPLEHGAWKTDEEMPNYLIGAKRIEQISGEDPLAKFALMRGYARIGDIPEKLLAEEETESRIAWLVEKIPPAARKQQEKWLSLVEDIVIDLGTLDEVKEQNHDK